MRETDFGTGKRSYTSENIKAMTGEQAGLIHRRDWWDAVRATPARWP